MNSFLLSIFI